MQWGLGCCGFSWFARKKVLVWEEEEGKLETYWLKHKTGGSCLQIGCACASEFGYTLRACASEVEPHLEIETCFDRFRLPPDIRPTSPKLQQQKVLFFFSFPMPPTRSAR